MAPPASLSRHRNSLLSYGRSTPTITLPTNSVTLNGTVSDDGLPTGSTLTITWTKTSGPWTVTFANASQPSTTAIFSAAGIYVLRLTASDTEYTVFAETVVTVNPAPGSQPFVEIDNPLDGAELKTRTSVTGR